MTTLSDILETTAPEQVATGFVFTEGPLWDPDQNYSTLSMFGLVSCIA